MTNEIRLSLSRAAGTTGELHVDGLGSEAHDDLNNDDTVTNLVQRLKIFLQDADGDKCDKSLKSLSDAGNRALAVGPWTTSLSGLWTSTPLDVSPASLPSHRIVTGMQRSRP